MTLDEAILHAEEVAEENQVIVDACDYYGDNMAKCETCAKEHIQLAEWLRELKQLKEQEPKTVQFARWVATEIFDDSWEYNKDSFAEIACRKLAELGIVRAKGDEWELVESQESEDK